RRRVVGTAPGPPGSPESSCEIPAAIAPRIFTRAGARRRWVTAGGLSGFTRRLTDGARGRCAHYGTMKTLARRDKCAILDGSSNRVATGEGVRRARGARHGARGTAHAADRRPHPTLHVFVSRPPLTRGEGTQGPLRREPMSEASAFLDALPPVEPATAAQLL